MKERIEKIMQKEGFNPVTFANHLGINKNTLIAALGRNKTISMVIVNKVRQNFPEINPDWLMGDECPMYRREKVYIQPERSFVQGKQSDLFENAKINTYEKPKGNESLQEPIIKVVRKEEQIIDNQTSILHKAEEKKIEKIVVFYTDKTFTTLIPEE
jgi:hypothetical protein